MSRARGFLPALLVFLLVLGLWEAAVYAFSIQFYLLPAPHAVLAAFGESYPVLLEAAVTTFGEALLGYGIGCASGLLLAMAASRSPAVAGLVLPYAVASASVPLVALAPLAIVWFGIGPGSKIALVAVMTFFPILVSALRGLLSVDRRSLELMRSCAASGWQVFWKLRLPHSAPLTFTALRACTTLAMIGAVVGEFFGGEVTSLGVYIKSRASLFQTRQAWAAILVACVLGLAFYLAVAGLERLLVPWRADRERWSRGAA